METNSNKSIAVEKSLSGIDGWLAFNTVAAGVAAVGFIWAFFLSIVAMTAGVSGVGLGVAIETLIFSLGLVFLCGFTLFLIVNRKKVAKMWAYITLGAMALYVTIVSITTMFSSTQSCSYGSGSSYFYNMQQHCETVGLPAGAIVALIGLIFVSWAGAVLVAYYFKKSQRVALTLTK